MEPKEHINEILDMYVKYAKALELDPLPVIALEPTELKTALIRECDKKMADRYLTSKSIKMDALGVTWRLRESVSKEYNDVVFINVSKMKELRGLHEITHTEKRTKRYIYKLRTKIGHLEETLIHELVHVKYPRLRHGKQFDSIVKGLYYQLNQGVNNG